MAAHLRTAPTPSSPSATGDRVCASSLSLSGSAVHRAKHTHASRFSRKPAAAQRRLRYRKQQRKLRKQQHRSAAAARSTAPRVPLAHLRALRRPKTFTRKTTRGEVWRSRRSRRLRLPVFTINCYWGVNGGGGSFAGKGSPPYPTPDAKMRGGATVAPLLTQR